MIFPAMLFVGSFCLQAQKKALDHSVYDAWQSVGTRLISADGKWVAYTITPQEGDADLFLNHQQTTQKFPRGTAPVFTSDARFAVFGIKPFYKDIKAVKDKKLKKEKLTKDSLAIVNLSNSMVEKLPNVQSYKVPRKGGSWLAYLLADPKNVEKDDKDADDKKDNKPKPSVLVLQNLVSGKKTQYDNVTRYELSENGSKLAFVTQKPEEKKDKSKTDDEKKDEPKDKSTPKKYALQSVNIVDLPTGKLQKVIETEGDFSQLSFDRLGNQLAFVGTQSAENDLVKDYQLYLFSNNKLSTIGNSNSKMPKDWVLSENREPRFSKNAKQLFFGIAPRPIPKDTALITNDHAVVDIWNYKDDYLQTVQLKRLKDDLKKSYAAVLQTDHPQIFQPLGNEELESMELLNDGDSQFVLMRSDKEGRVASQWMGSTLGSYYLVNTLTGEKRPVVENLQGRAVASPLGKYVIYFNRADQNWYAYEVASAKTRQLNKDFMVSFGDELWDTPDVAAPYGIASWTDKDESVIIRDRYDLWEFFLDGKKKPRNITNGYGRANAISFNTFDFDPEDVRSLNRKAPIYLSAFNEKNKQEGLYRTTIAGSKNPENIFMDDIYGVRSLAKAKNADRYIFTKENYQQSPNLYATADFKNQQQLTNINPQQQNYSWGTAELVHWTTPNGYPSTGVLYKPEDFDANKEYPMIVYFYEKLSDNLNRYVAPAPTPSRLNISYFVSNGYLVFTPDISYQDGKPGQSAVEYINSGVEYLKKNPWVDGKKIGIQGQSWGGYQVAYLITQNDMYAAAWSGAPVVNMTSAYGGIRWESGMNRQFQYEKSQSRIGKTLWEAPELYYENSPLFHMDKVNTPVVIMANDNDGAVPWYQGIEMFTALRRLGKPVWMLNYNGDEHNLMKRQNRKDIQIREQQFFDHYLKGAKAPVWMTRGVPATMKGKDWGLELDNEFLP